MIVSKEGMKSAMAFVVAGLGSALVGNWVIGTVAGFMPTKNPLVGTLVVGLAGAVLLSRGDKFSKIAGGALVLTAVYNGAPALLAMVRL